MEKERRERETEKERGGGEGEGAERREIYGGLWRLSDKTVDIYIVSKTYKVPVL